MKTRSQFVILMAFTVSGAFGLMYEVIWQRQLALIFGSTLPATTAILTAFMAGLAAGSWIFGRISHRFSRPFSVYGYLEIAIGIYCLAMPWLFERIFKLHASIYNTIEAPYLFDAIRFGIAIAILIIPCSMMGGTLPILSRGIIRHQPQIGKSLSSLYFFNTIGASFGTLIAGFVLIRFLGLNLGTYITASLNIILGTAICLFSNRLPDRSSESIPEQTSTREKTLLVSLLPYLYAFLGAAAMGTQVAWTRALNLVLGSTVYAFALMLTTFLFGIAVGSLVIGKFIDRKSSPVSLVGVLSFMVFISIILSIVMISRLPVILIMLFPLFHQKFLIWQLCLCLMIMIVVFPATFFMGALFPAFGRAYISQLKNVGKQVGDLYVWNTVGGIAGSIVSGFLLIPLIGTRLSLIVYAAVFLIIGITLLLITSGDRRTSFRIFLLFLICLIGYQAIPDWEPELLDSGVYVYAPQLTKGFESNRKILYEREGYHSHVTVSEKNSVRSLRINGKTDGSDGNDLATQVLLAVLPMSHQSGPLNTLIIGLGTGVTAGSALNFPNSRVDCVEIDDAVITAARYFNHVSGDPFSNERFRVLHADARTVIGAGSTRYHTIISEPSNPWITGVSSLFTVDYFQEAQDNLTEDGVMCQWIHSYYMDTETLLVIFRSFQHVFQFCSLWEGSPGDYLILGSHIRERVTVREDYSLLFTQDMIKADLERIGIMNSTDYANRCLLGSEEFKRMTLTNGSRLNTDDRPYVEFNAPRSLYHDTVQENKAFIDSFRRAL